MTEKTEAQVYLGLFIAIPVAIAINIILAIVGGRWMNKLSHKSGEDVLTAHYLGGRSFGTWVTFGTMVSTNLILPDLLLLPHCSSLSSHVLTLSTLFDTIHSLRLASPASLLLVSQTKHSQQAGIRCNG
jgi:hypothetical protein